MGLRRSGVSDGIRVLIVAAVRLYRDGLARFLGSADRIEVVGTAPALPDALDLAYTSQPDIVLLDSTLGEGRSAVRAFARTAPGAPIIALALTDTPAEVIAWAEAGIGGYVCRDDSLEQLVTVINSVVRGEMPCSPQVSGGLLQRVAALAADQPLAGVADLTSRELEVAALLRRGLSNKEIGRQLCIELPTVKNHVHHILEKLKIDARSKIAARLPQPDRI
jgi:two-component system, NarL family, nitrate/nitrite response regulator NarL